MSRYSTGERLSLAAFDVARRALRAHALAQDVATSAEADAARPLLALRVTLDEIAEYVESLREQVDAAARTLMDAREAA